MKRMLIAYDGSSCADAALEDLTRAGLPSELEVMVLSVAEVWLPPEAPPPCVAPAVRFPLAVLRAREAAWRAVEEDSRRLAARASERLRALFPHWRVQPMAVGDSPACGVVKKAAEWSADLVVVGSHGRSAMERFFLGSVSHKVANEVGCSVRVARPRLHSPHPSPRILVAVDGSRDSEVAVRAALARQWPALTRFQLVTVIDSRLKTAAALPSHWGRDWMQPHDAEAGEWVCRAVERLAAAIREAKLDLETHIFDGDPKHLLLHHAEEWKADCILLGAHGLEHGPRRALGTLASAVATRAHCSVEIVREKTSEAEVAPTRIAS